jgi:CHAT domain-containing protein/tetratricopeptide (TPR) repeat protein
LILLLALGSAQTGNAATAPTLSPSNASEAQLDAGQNHRYRIDLPGGRTLRVSVQQKDAMLQWHWTDSSGAGSPKLSTQAGRMARLDATLIADTAASFEIEIHASKADRPASYRIVLGAVHAITAEDRARAKAERAFAEAEAIRLAAGGVEQGQREADTVAALARYRDAATLWRGLGAACAAMAADVGLARFELAQANYPQAQKAAQTALGDGCKDSGDLSSEADRAAAWRTLGAASGYQGDFEAAAAASEKALATYRLTGDMRFQGVVLSNLSPVYRSLGEMQKSLASARMALTLAEQTHDAQGVVFSRENIANTYLARGELALALQTYRTTLDDLRTTPYPMTEGLVWNELGAVYRRLGEADAARDAWTHARTIWETTDNRSGMTETLINEGRSALDDGDPAVATNDFEKARDIAASDRLRSPELHARLGLGLVATRAGRLAEADAHLNWALDIARQIGEIAAQAEVELALGDLDDLRHRRAAAEGHYALALDLAHRASDAAIQAAARASVARLELDRGDPQTARTSIELALTQIENQRARIAEPELRTSYFASQRAYHDLHVDALMELDRIHPAQGYDRLALEASERARARALHDLLRERNIGIASRVNSLLLTAEHDAEDAQRKAAYRMERLASTLTAGQRVELRREVDDASRTLDDARGRIRVADPRYAALTNPPLSLAAMRRELLGDDTVVYEYWLGESRSYLWRIGRSGLRSWALPARAQIEHAAESLREVLLAPAEADPTQSFEQRATALSRNDESVRGRAQTLAALIWPQDADVSSGKPLAIVADGELQRIPYGLLPPLSERAIVYLPSLATLHELRAGVSPKHGDASIAVFADPVFEADDVRIRKQDGATTPAADAGARVWPRLARTRTEASEIAALFPAAQRFVATDFAASRTTVLDAAWPHGGYAHFATHALIDLQHPELSGIVLSLYDETGHPQDGFMRMNDIYGLSLPAELVTLGVCESTHEHGRGAEGMFGLSRAFFYAGARRLLVSLWPVDDRASEKLMVAFYRHLVDDRTSPQDALRAAQADLRRDPRWHSPYYWAGFVVHGDWR